MKRMLINATHGVRVALVDGQSLYDLDIERTQKQTVNNIYLGRVNRVEPSLAAAFVDFGSIRDGFLPMKEVAREYFKDSYSPSGSRPNIKDVLEPGQELIIQVVKEERGNKGAALRTFISLAGRYLVLMPNNPRAGGISRQIEGEEREELKASIDQLNIPEGMGIIVRTAGMGRNIEEWQWDLEVLLCQWKAIQEAAKSKPAPFLIHQEGDVITRALRDNLRPDIEEILVDSQDAYDHAKDHLLHTRPEYVDKLKLYQDNDPLFNRYQIESQIESAFQRVVGLDNGASIVIDPAEALTAIDINSAKATEGSDIEETAFLTNIAAAKEISRQLRLRDLGGLIVIDFIDMSSTKHQREVEKVLREELKKDRARVQMGRITRFGLLEMSRQRLQPSLGDANLVSCPRCDGQGTIRGVESLSLSLLRVIEEESIKPNTGQVRVQVPVEVATFLMNEKRDVIFDLEKRHEAQILIIPNQNFSTPHYDVARIKQEDLRQSRPASYKLVKDKETEAQHYQLQGQSTHHEEPAIKHIPSSLPAPQPKALTKESGLIRRLWRTVFGNAPKDDEANLSATPKSRDKTRPKRQQNAQDHASSDDSDRQSRPSQQRGNKRRPNNSRNRSNRQNQQNRRPDHRQEAGQENPRRDNSRTDQPTRSDNSRAEQSRQDTPRADRTRTDSSRNEAAKEPREQTQQTQQTQQARSQGRDHRQDSRKKDNRSDGRRTRSPRQTPAPANQTVNLEQPRKASDDELKMHTLVQKDTKTSKPPQQQPLSSQAKGGAPQQQATQTKSETSSPASKAPTEVKNQPTTHATTAPAKQEAVKDPRRDQIGFIKLSEEKAQAAVVKIDNTAAPKTSAEHKLNQVTTRSSEKSTAGQVAAPKSALATVRNQSKKAPEMVQSFEKERQEVNSEE